MGLRFFYGPPILPWASDSAMGLRFFYGPPILEQSQMCCPISYSLHNEIREQLGIHTHRHLGAATVVNFPSDQDRQVSLTVANDTQRLVIKWMTDDYLDLKLRIDL
ncbi:hypothetical protein CRE_22976 [Caenorhabditis remanei]|uniref:Uncharacterized protein n=1 Tax=Caenorhabditis remanei TaxID=31234 RepID=E3MW46_CAERE|nr:hypothetical protein CRE_22976 [Caenorhabditis remanei]